MENGRKLLRRVTLAAIAVIGLGGLLTFLFESPSIAAVERPDVIRIDAVGQHKALEMPPAVFEHDKHMQKLAKKGQDCTVCHTGSGNARGSFMGSADVTDPEQLKALFHNGCITCHNEMGDGPRDGECRTCHDASGSITSKTRPVTFDRSMHAVHVASKNIRGPLGSDQNCGACHHVYDEKLGKLVWIPGTEDNCAACHTKKAEGKKPALQTAVHTKCVWCHTDVANEQRAALTPQKAAVRTKPTAAQKEAIESAIASGPVSCAECHTEAGQSQFKKVENAPRLFRGQPDAIVMSPRNADGKRVLDSGTKPVVFNHKQHEASADSCRVCHHVKIASCSECHTQQGTPEGKLITLEQAMHTVKASQSCIGCHQQKIQSNPKCAGCHGSIPVMTEQSCTVCHASVPALDAAHLADAPAAGDRLEEQLGAVAKQHLAEKAAAIKPLSPSEMPETVTIGSLSNEFGPSVFPHRKIYEALLSGTADSNLASAFHTTPTTLCAACHHNSPQSGLMTPPACASCHAAQADKKAVEANKPSLKAAYHQQCMACHDRMGVTKPANTDCTGCHAKK